jgi:LAGLIDADG endonuclease
MLIGIKFITIKGKSAEVKSKNFYSEASQRLNARDFYSAYLVGLIEGDGWFTVTKNGKYIIYELVIELNIRDVQLLYKI